MCQTASQVKAQGQNLDQRATLIGRWGEGGKHIFLKMLSLVDTLFYSSLVEILFFSVANFILVLKTQKE